MRAGRHTFCRRIITIAFKDGLLNIYENLINKSNISVQNKRLYLWIHMVWHDPTNYLMFSANILLRLVLGVVKIIKKMVFILKIQNKTSEIFSYPHPICCYPCCWPICDIYGYSFLLRKDQKLNKIQNYHTQQDLQDNWQQI